MPNVIRNSLRGLVLSAIEIKNLTRWPGAMVEDYLNLLDNFISLATQLDNMVDVVRVTADYTTTSSDGTIFADTTDNPIEIFLAAGAEGMRHRIVNTGLVSNNVTITPNGTELLNGFNASETLYDSESLDLQYDLTDGWF